MAAIDILYLSVVPVAFLGFAGVLAFVSHRDRLPKERPDPRLPLRQLIGANSQCVGLKSPPDYDSALRLAAKRSLHGRD
jgi:hypothetical protein